MSRGTIMDRESPDNPVIRLEVGQPNFRTPDFIVEATIKALREGHTTYNPNNGVLSLRETIAEKYCTEGHATETDQIVVTNGYLPTLETIEEQVTPHTKCIILCNPGNPTGATYPHELLKRIVHWAHARGIFVISDEIYSDIVFDAPHTSAAQLEGDSLVNSDLLAIVSGVSKGYAMTGYRVGWTRCSPTLAAQLTKIQEPLVSCASPFNQLAAAVALREGHSAVEYMRRQYHKRRDIALNILKQRGRESSCVPGGAFYLPVDVSFSGLESKDFALKLLYEKRCAIAPGIAFNTMDPVNIDGYSSSYNVSPAKRQEFEELLNGFCRVSLANSEENVSKGISLICDLLDETSQK
eukprot:gene13667-15720_t